MKGYYHVDKQIILMLPSAKDNCKNVQGARQKLQLHKLRMCITPIDDMDDAPEPAKEAPETREPVHGLGEMTREEF